MLLDEWIEKQGYGAIAALSRVSGVSMLTIGRIRKGKRLRNTTRAQALSDATKGEVPVAALLDLPAKENPKALRRSA
jgi:hypothetical protein